MKSTPFDVNVDKAPIPFTDETCQTAKLMKQNGLIWRPHVGCFVWDEHQIIEVPSPFPNQIYFILNLGHFLKRFETIENIADQLVWLPTWHQARQICKQLDIPDTEIWQLTQDDLLSERGMELQGLYNLIIENLQQTAQ